MSLVVIVSALVLKIAIPFFKWASIIIFFPITFPWFLFRKWMRVKWPEIWLVDE